MHGEWRVHFASLNFNYCGTGHHQTSLLLLLLHSPFFFLSMQERQVNKMLLNYIPFLLTLRSLCFSVFFFGQPYKGSTARGTC